MSTFFTSAVTFIILAIVGVLVGWVAKRPNRIKGYPGRVRMPKIVPIVGWLLVPVGILMGLVAFLSPPENALGMRIASVCIFLGGLLFLAMYRNFYVAAAPDEVYFRTILGREKSIRYSDIDTYSFFVTNSQQMLMVRSAQGVKLNVNAQMYALDPLVDAIRFKEQFGRWPLVGEPRAQRA